MVTVVGHGNRGWRCGCHGNSCRDMVIVVTGVET